MLSTETNRFYVFRLVQPFAREYWRSTCLLWCLYPIKSYYGRDLWTLHINLLMKKAKPLRQDSQSVQFFSFLNIYLCRLFQESLIFLIRTAVLCYLWCWFFCCLVVILCYVCVTVSFVYARRLQTCVTGLVRLIVTGWPHLFLICELFVCRTTLCGGRLQQFINDQIVCSLQSVRRQSFRIPLRSYVVRGL